MNAKTVEILAERPEHHNAIETLLDVAFGPGRFAKTAYRLREGTATISELSFVAVSDGAVVGSIRFSPIMIGGTPALLLGPLVVHPHHKNRGHGVKLMMTGLECAGTLGHRFVILVGDAPYYARVGFSQVPRGQVRLPGPVDPDRLLGLDLQGGGLGALCGLARPAPAVSAALAIPGER